MTPIILLLIFLTPPSQAQECPNSCKCSGLITGKYTVNCAQTNISSVPTGIPYYTTDLILDDNDISKLVGDSFGTGLTNLVRLSIRSNNLTYLESDTFKGLTALKNLDLFNNSLELNTSFPSDVFEPLAKTLKTLDIRKNLMQFNTSLVDYPIAIASLKSLETLKMDCVMLKPLPKEYKELTNLGSIIFGGGRTDTVRLAVDMFDAVADLNVTEIDLQDLRLGFMNGTTLGKVKSLKTLDISNNPGLGIALLKIVDYLRLTSIETLRMNNTYLGDHATYVIRLMKNLKHLKYLTIDNNNIFDIDPILTESIPNIEILSIASNYIYERSDFIWDIYRLKKLVGLNASWEQTETSMFQNPVRDSGRLFFHMCQVDTACPVRTPPNMLWLDMSHYGLHMPDFPELAIVTNSSLKYVNAAYTGLQYFKKPFFCRTGAFATHVSVETFDFRFNTIQCFNKSIFDSKITHCRWDTLKHFYLGSNKLGDVNGNICNKDKTEILTFLKPLKKLVVLDLSLNGLGSNLKYDDLKGLNSLEEINLSQNNLYNFSLNIANMTKLKMLDISENHLPCLTKSMSRSLDRILRQHTSYEPIYVNLTGNLLKCNCQCLDFYQWLQKTNVHVLNYRNLHCVFPNGKEFSLNRLHTIVAKLVAECYTTLWLDIGIVILLLIYCLIFVLTMMFRMRHDIKYMWIKMKMNREKLERIFFSKKYIFRFDAFVSCEHTDARSFVYRHLLPTLETKNKGLTAKRLNGNNTGIKLAPNGIVDEAPAENKGPDLSFCIAQRDFVVGDAIIQNVIRCMKESRKVILLVSNQFLASRWCIEEMRIAHQESLDRGKNIIVCVFMPGVDQEQLPGTIKMITKLVTCLQWPRDEKAQKVFWLMLQRAIMDGVQAEDNFAEV